MKSPVFRATVVALLHLLVASNASAQQPKSCGMCGDWEGRLDFGSVLQPIVVHFRQDSIGNVGGTIDLPSTGRMGLPLTSTTLTADSVLFTFAGRSGVGSFAGVSRPDAAIVGRFSQSTSSAPFHLVRTLTPDLSLNSQYGGSYRLSATRFLDMGPFQEDGNRIGVFDSETLRYHVLHATSDREFFAGPSVGVAYPKQVRVTFERNASGEVTGLRWRDGAAEMWAPKVVPNRIADITFWNGDVEMRGTLVLPAGLRRSGVVVFAPGSGPARRPGGYWPYFLARQGIGTLTFDKRGAGESKGDWRTASYSDLAGDLLGAIKVLRQRSDVDTARIGIWANSESGWTAPIATARSSDVKFLIIRSGSALPVADAVAVEAEMKMRDGSTLSEADIAAALALKVGVEKLALSPEPWEQVWPRIDSAYTAAKDKPWISVVPQAPKDHWFWPMWRLRGNFDPDPSLAKIRVPVLVLLGDQDCCMPVATQNAAAYERIFKASGHRDATVRILPNASHGLMRATSKFGSEGPRLTGYVPGYLEGIEAWLRQRGFLAR